MFPKKGKTLHRGPADSDRETEFRQEVAVALKSELGSSPQVVKDGEGSGRGRGSMAVGVPRSSYLTTVGRFGSAISDSRAEKT